MKLNFFAELNHSIEKISSNIDSRSDSNSVKKNFLEALANPKLTKVAFDTRNIDPYQYNPRRNLQNYNRSQQFISEATSNALQNFAKLKLVVDLIEKDYYNNPDYLDSYARILKNSLDKALRVEQKDFDFDARELDYLNQLIYSRYRLDQDMIKQSDEKLLRQAVLAKDEKLMYAKIYNFNKSNSLISQSADSNIIKQTVVPVQQDSLLDTLFAGVKATAENKKVSRSVTVTINDEIKE
jgi:hypothetical protein